MQRWSRFFAFRGQRMQCSTVLCSAAPPRTLPLFAFPHVQRKLKQISGTMQFRGRGHGNGPSEPSELDVEERVIQGP